MSYFLEIKEMNEVADGYLEIIMNKEFPIQSTRHMLYLNESDFLTLFVNPFDLCQIYVDVFEKIPIFNYLKMERIDKKVLIDLFEQMMDVLENAKGYLVMHELTYIYIQPETKKLQLIKIPVQSYLPRYEKQFIQFAISMIEMINFEGDEAFLSNIYMCLKQPHFSFPLFRNFLHKKKQKKRWFFFQKDEDFQMSYPLYVKESEAIYQQEKTTMFTDMNKTQLLPSNLLNAFLVDENEKEIFISDVQFSIGRDISNHLQLNYKEVSKVHALIYQEEDHYYIIDKQSTNGTKVNDLLIENAHCLKDGDIINIAKHLLTYHELSHY